MGNRIKNKKIDNKSDNEKLDAATDWLLLLNQEEVKVSIINNFKSWLAQDKTNQTSFKEVLQVWQLSALIAPKYVENIEHLLFDVNK